MALNILAIQFLNNDSGEFSIASSPEYIWFIYLPIMVWLVLMVVFFILLFRKYTFGNWSEENPNPHYGETFDMPRGTFRGMLTLTLLFVVTVLELVSVHTLGMEDNVREYIVAFQMMIAFYFGSKVMHHITSAEKHKTKTIAEQKTRQHEVLIKAKFKAKKEAESPAPEPGILPEGGSSDFDDPEAAG